MIKRRLTAYGCANSRCWCLLTLVCAAAVALLLLHCVACRYSAETASGKTEVKDHILDDSSDELWRELRHEHIADVYSSLSKRFTDFQDKNKAAKYQTGKGEWGLLQAHTDTHVHARAHTDREEEGWTDRQAGRQTDRQTDRREGQAGWQADRQAGTRTHTLALSHTHTNTNTHSTLFIHHQ